MTQLFLVPEHADVDNLKALLKEAKLERKRLREAYQRAQWKVARLQNDLKRLTSNHRRKAKRGALKEEA